MRTIFFDIETTGLSPHDGHRVIEIGAVAYEDGNLIEGDRFHRLINPERDVPIEATEIHGHATKDLQGKELFKDVAEEFRNFVAGADLYAHNAGFDVSFLDMEFDKLGHTSLSEIANKIVDTLAVARSKMPGSSHSLDALARRAGIDVDTLRVKHTAIIDAEILAEVYFFIIRGQATLDLSQLPTTEEIELLHQTKKKFLKFKERAEVILAHNDFLKKMKEVSKGVEPIMKEISAKK